MDKKQELQIVLNKKRVELDGLESTAHLDVRRHIKYAIEELQLRLAESSS